MVSLAGSCAVSGAASGQVGVVWLGEWSSVLCAVRVVSRCGDFECQFHAHRNLYFIVLL